MPNRPKMDSQITTFILIAIAAVALLGRLFTECQKTVKKGVILSRALKKAFAEVKMTATKPEADLLPTPPPSSTRSRLSLIVVFVGWVLASLTTYLSKGPVTHSEVVLIATVTGLVFAFFALRAFMSFMGILEATLDLVAALLLTMQDTRAKLDRISASR